MIEQIVYAEQLGFDTVWLPEHHFSPGDGYNPAPLTFAAAIAARTKKIKIGTWLLLLPLHHALEVAEQAAIIDIISDGRLILGLGLGYRKEEYEAFGVSRKHRASRMEEGLEVIRKALGTEQFSFSGRHYDLKDASVYPKPVQQPGPPIWVAGNSKAAMKRAARYADAWHPVRPTLEFLVEAKADLNRYLEEESRNPESHALALKLPLVVENEASGTKLPTRGRPADIAAAIEGYRELGASHFVFDLVPEELTTTLDTMEQFAQEIRPRLS